MSQPDRMLVLSSPFVRLTAIGSLQRRFRESHVLLHAVPPLQSSVGRVTEPVSPRTPIDQVDVGRIRLVDFLLFGERRMHAQRHDFAALHEIDDRLVDRFSRKRQGVDQLGQRRRTNQIGVRAGRMPSVMNAKGEVRRAKNEFAGRIAAVPDVEEIGQRPDRRGKRTQTSEQVQLDIDVVLNDHRPLPR